MNPGDQGQRTASAAGPGSLVVDEHAILFRCESGVVLDLMFDGRRVWSFASDEFPEDADGIRRTEWPRPIQTRLDGIVQLELREHATGQQRASVEAKFGTGTGRVRLVDKAGRPVALTKYGRLNRPFETVEREVVEAYLDQVEGVLGVLRDDCGLPAFLAFGSMLGAVRQGGLIGHDVDCDLGYFSSYQHPVDVIRESFAVERVLHANGYKTVRENGGFLALFLPQSDGSTRNLDIFTAFEHEGRLYQLHDVATRGGVDDVLPLGTAEFEGRSMPVPHRPETFLVAAYGPGWRTPDPAFKFSTPREDKRRFRGWFGGWRERRDFWIRHYGRHADRIPREPSTFAMWVAEREQPGSIVDVGCGNGRDTRYFAELGFRVLGLDLLPRVSVPTMAGMAEATMPEVANLNLQSVRQTLAMGARLAHQSGPVTVYARFVLHALTTGARHNFWRLASMAVRGGGHVYVEFRTQRDRRLPKVFGEHYRQFLSPADMATEAAAQGLRVVDKMQGRGLAPLKTEDPQVCRMILEYHR